MNVSPASFKILLTNCGITELVLTIDDKFLLMLVEHHQFSVLGNTVTLLAWHMI